MTAARCHGSIARPSAAACRRTASSRIRQSQAGPSGCPVSRASRRAIARAACSSTPARSANRSSAPPDTPGMVDRTGGETDVDIPSIAYERENAKCADCGCECASGSAGAKLREMPWGPTQIPETGKTRKPESVKSAIPELRFNSSGISSSPIRTARGVCCREDGGPKLQNHGAPDPPRHLPKPADRSCPDPSCKLLTGHPRGKRGGTECIRNRTRVAATR